MRQILFSLAFIASAFSASAQSVINFDTLYLSKPDTFYTNYSNPGMDVGFNIGSVHFDCVYDTAWGGIWNGGFAYSNMKDSVTSGYTNQYAAKTGTGYANSPNYVVYYTGYGNEPKIKLPGVAAVKRFTGFYVTNSTYAYNSMRDGDFVSKKFGGTTGNDPDWFKLVVRGYFNGQLKNDSVAFYLADFRSSNNANDYIIKDWTWLSLDSLGNVDSISFELSSSDVGQFGMNTPAYFCMDNLNVLISTSIDETNASNKSWEVYPNPINEFIKIENRSIENYDWTLFTSEGKLLKSGSEKSSLISISTSELPSGVYYLKMNSDKNQLTQAVYKY